MLFLLFLIEILIILIIASFAWSGFRRGFISQLFDLVGIVGSFLIALRYYNFMATLLEDWGVRQVLSRAIGFFTIWILSEGLFYLLFLLILRFIPQKVHSNSVNRWLGILPGAVKGVIIMAIVLMIFFVTPLAPKLKDQMVAKPISGTLIKFSTKITSYVEGTIGNNLNALTFFSKLSPSDEATKLNFQTNNYTIDPASEEAMIRLVNLQRVEAGLKPLQADNLIRNVARAHSIDMVQNGYFAHTDLSLGDPLSRMTSAGVSFWVAGENIALAPSYEAAEVGFMNSPKHRDNILDPSFGRVGIGIIDAGIYGKMITQNFAN